MGEESRKVKGGRREEEGRERDRDRERIKGAGSRRKVVIYEGGIVVYMKIVRAK